MLLEGVWQCYHRPVCRTEAGRGGAGRGWTLCSAPSSPLIVSLSLSYRTIDPAHLPGLLLPPYLPSLTCFPPSSPSFSLPSLPPSSCFQFFFLSSPSVFSYSSQSTFYFIFLLHCSPLFLYYSLVSGVRVPARCFYHKYLFSSFL